MDCSLTGRHDSSIAKINSDKIGIGNDKISLKETRTSCETQHFVRADAETSYMGGAMYSALRSGEVDSRIYPPHKIIAIAKELSNGLGGALLAGTGLGPQEIEAGHTKTSTRQLITVCANALRLSKDDPELPFRVGASLHVSSYTLYGYALLCMPDARSACRMASQYHQLSNPLVDVTWHEDEGPTAWWNLPATPPARFPPMSADQYQFMLDIQFAVTATLHQDVFGTSCVPVKAVVAKHRPTHAEIYKKYLRCPVEVVAGRNELHFPATFLDKPTLFPNAVTAAIMTDVCDQLLTEMRVSSGFVGAVYRALMRTPGRFPGTTAIADELHTTPRTLLRRLKAEGTSYRQLLNELRRSLAIGYLRNTQLGVEDIAATLGFASAAAFQHAFKRWTGCQPAEYRPSVHQPDPFRTIGSPYRRFEIKS